MLANHNYPVSTPFSLSSDKKQFVEIEVVFHLKMIYVPISAVGDLAATWNPDPHPNPCWRVADSVADVEANRVLQSCS